MSTTTQILPLTETVTPADEAEVVDVVRKAHERGTPIYPIGGGTSLDYGPRPRRPGIGLSMRRLDQVVDHAADDMTITVQAGLGLAELARRLNERRQRLPVDVADARRATVGGAAATDAAGPRRYGFGTMRDYVIGIRAVDGCGSAFAGGGRVVKNAAGYNLCRLLVGSLGRLGVITQVTLMVRPMPEASTLLVGEVADFDSAERALAALIHSKTVPVAVELQAGCPRRDNPVMGPMLESSAARLLVGFEGSRADVDWMVDALREEWRSLGIRSALTVSAAEADALWDWLSAFPAQVQIGVRPRDAVGMVERLLRLDPGCSIQAHAQDGIIRAALSPAPPDRFVAILREQLRPAVAAAEGRMSVRSYPHGAELCAEDVWGPSGDAAALGRAIKDRFDPKGLLNPGRFAGQD